MKLPAIERTLLGLWIAHDALEQFLNETDAECSREVSQLDDEQKRQHRDKLRELIGLDDEDAAVFAWQIRQSLAILECTVMPHRIRAARETLSAIAETIGDPGRDA